MGWVQIRAKIAKLSTSQSWACVEPVLYRRQMPAAVSIVSKAVTYEILFTRPPAFSSAQN